MTSDPQYLAVEALVARFKMDYVVSRFTPDNPRDYSCLVPRVENGETGLSALTFGEVVDCLADAGLLVTPQASSAERDKEELVQRIIAQLSDYMLNIGPNTRELITSGQWKRMPLSVSERREIAELAAEEALKQAVQRDDL